MGWEQSTGMAAVDSLYKKGIITDAELWKSEDMKGATPLWLTFLLVDKLSGDEPQKEESQKKRYVKVDTSVLNVRHAPKGKIVSQVYQRDVLEVLDEQDGWFRIKNEKVTGWVSGDYVVALGSF